jgi:hypothetical protein
MDAPKPINIYSDSHWRALGWSAVARDADGHAISTCSIDHNETFNEWLRECFDDGLAVTGRRRMTMR